MDFGFDRAVETFHTNTKVVEQLLDFGNLIVDTAVGGLREVEGQLEQRNQHNAVTLVRNRADLLAQVKQGDSLRPHYEVMFNQCVVLLVSHFGSSVHELFRRGVEGSLKVGADVPAAKQELKVSWSSVAQSEEKPESLFANLLIAQQDISFQDMQSIGRAFKSHLHVEIDRSGDVNDIILGQAARHVIVHSGGLVDHKMVRQVAEARPRTLKPEISLGDPIQFAPDEVRSLAGSMSNYLAALLAKLTSAATGWPAA
jgi:hypothetical protein